jgi:FtsZ-interacting cell division protein ZipA
MSQLRWILLTLGALFIAALAWWELRRPRQAPHDGAEHREPPPALPQIRPREPVRELPVMHIGNDPELVAVDVPPAPILSTPPPPEPVVEWPPEEARRILTLRIIAARERFAGRTLRQALSAQGFVHGRLSIFHKAGGDSRAVLSAASLTQPGNFDLATMDTLRYGGLNIFAVLPGPLPAPEAFEELLASARQLNERLQGTLQDERGDALTAARVAIMRAELAGQSSPPADAPP